MKKATAVLLALIAAFMLAAGTVFAESIELDEIYAVYGLGETIVIRGTISRSGAVVYLFDPDMNPCYWLTVDRKTIAEGLEIEFGPERRWILGEYLLKVCYGTEFVQEYHIELVEGPVDRTPDTPTTSGQKKLITATAVSISPSRLALKVGETADVQILTDKTAVTWETDDADMITIEGTNNAKITAKKTGRAVAWAYSGNNYATLTVDISPADRAPANSEKEPKEPEPKEEKQLFTDLGTVLWAKESINSLAEAKVINGMGGGIFAPEAYVTRAQFVKMIVQAFGFEGKGDAAFSDVSEENDWFAEPVLVAANNKIVNGYGEDFRPNDNISCQDAALILSRVANMKGIKLPNAPAEEAEASEYAREAVGLLKSNGVIGSEMGFESLKKATRAQSAYLIYNIYRLK